MIFIDKWLEEYCQVIEPVFGERIKFIGLQGSYGRDEAAEGSDIDVVLILDKLDMEDLITYEEALNNISYRELVCGFISGWDELRAWDKGDRFQFYYDTIPVKGSIKELFCDVDSKAVMKAAHLEACNIYHECIHNYVHEKDLDLLRGLYKTARFVMQALHFCKTGEYIKKKSELADCVEAGDKKIIENEIYLGEALQIDEDVFREFSNDLFVWTKKIIVGLPEGE